jgi:inositol transport system ATP-binding protein
MNALLYMDSISKSYSGVRVLNEVSISLREGTVLALVGENGAGKSTLMRILAGETAADSGRIIYKGREVSFSTPRSALDDGIAMIHQEFNMALDMSVADNLFMGRDFRKGILVNKRRQYNEAVRFLKEVGLDLDVRQPVRNLTVAQMQMLEIAKAVSCDAQIFIMDEPTSAIAKNEIDTLYSIIDKLLSEGRSIIYISHKLEEIFRVADDISILRDGNLVGTFAKEELDIPKMIFHMVNRKIDDIFPPKNNSSGEVVLSVEGLTRKDKFKDISFSVRRGEILGLAGLMGAGRTEIAEALFGSEPLDSGKVYMHGKRIDIRTPKDSIKHRIGLIPDDRKTKGLVLGRDIKENICLASLDDFRQAVGVLNKKKYNQYALDYIKKLDVRCQSADQLSQMLSGGNQQKIVLARWLMRDCDVLILDEPTRGIDIGSKTEIYKLINTIAKKGKAVILISSELNEILGLCDRVVVLHEGKITGELGKEEMTQELVMWFATGQTKTGGM